MNADGISVLLEGREETVNHLRSPFRFELVMENDGVLGHRRCAQRVMAAGLQALQGQDGATSDAVQAALKAALEQISSEHAGVCWTLYCSLLLPAIVSSVMQASVQPPVSLH